MSIKKELQLSLNDDDGHYNFVLKKQNILSLEIDNIDIETVNEIFDGIGRTLEIALSTISKNSDGMVSFSEKE